MISVVIQGGAMRSIYCLGAIRALVDAGYGSQVRTIHVASAGCVSAAVLAMQLSNPDGPPITEVRNDLLDRLAGDRFINPRRLRGIVDVDYLVKTIEQVTSLSPGALSRQGLSVEVGMTDATKGTARYIDISTCPSQEDLCDALRATMAIPLLYQKQIIIKGNRYVDGGISDPLPVLRALQKNPTTIVAISSVALSRLGRELEGRESILVRMLPGLSSPVRHLLLARNPLGAAVEELTQQPVVGGVRMVRIAPLDQSKLGHRLETNRNKLLALDEMGYADGLQALSALRESPTMITADV